MANPNKKLLILDLDETLVHATPDGLDRPCDFLAPPYYVYRRPHLRSFLQECFDHYDVGVWTSASPAYARHVVYSVFPEPDRLVFVWASDRCTRAYDAETHQMYWRKPLRKLRTHRRQYSREIGDIVAVDDSPEKWELSYGNLVRVRPYKGDPLDDELLRLSRYLAWLFEVPDVRNVNKRGWHTHVTVRLPLRVGGCS